MSSNDFTDALKTNLDALYTKAELGSKFDTLTTAVGKNTSDLTTLKI